MCDLQYLINYIAEESSSRVSAPLKKYALFNEALIENNFFYRGNGNIVFAGISDTYMTTILLAQNQSLWYKGTSDDFVFYVKKTTNILGSIVEEYHQLGNNSNRTFQYTSLEETDDLSEIPLSYNQFKYHIYDNKLYLVFEEFFDIVVDGTEENFYHTRASLSELEDGDYDINYKDSLGLYDDFWDNLARNHPEKSLNRIQRKVTLNFNETTTKGRVYKFPTISEVNSTAGRITLDYNFYDDEPVITSKFINTNYAFRIEFNSYQAFLSFCNQVYFSRGLIFDLDIYPKVEKRFYEKYHEIVTDLIKRSKRSLRPQDNLIDIVWYLPQTYLQSDISYLPLLWDLMIAIIEEDDVNNRGLNKED